MAETPKDGMEFAAFMSRRLIAANEIAETEREWSAARARDDRLDSLEGMTPEHRLARIALNAAFYDIVESQGTTPEDAEAVLKLFTENSEVPNATLARIEMQGEWDGADGFERQLFPLMSTLYDRGYKKINFIPRTSDDVKRIITIPAGFTDEPGYVALSRKRRLLTAQHIRHGVTRPQIEMDKISMFALDIKKLAELSSDAADEVRLIVAMTMYRACDWSTLEHASIDPDSLDDMQMFNHLLDQGKRDLTANPRYSFETALDDAQRLSRAMRRYGITLEQILHRMEEVPEPTRLHSPEGEAFIEEALRARSDLLTPAATTYYIHS